MGIFRRNPPTSDDDRFKDNVEQIIADASADSAFKHRVHYAHEDYDASRGEVGKKPSGSHSGPSCDDANTPRRGRRW
ncbi:hypothetical protein [Streptomyces sp. WAC06614]|uniref:hypothetical protein n=1 Tax=Streptomyces sp. WAC06614 TaxID=2487416 RepID=UPI000F77CCBF|nr:hypothetical protein [Streptomyces sp. WAC06614]RSS70290.1 hypothetical protein EF918_27450 [Streptomyces sp. WAC06614]